MCASLASCSSWAILVAPSLALAPLLTLHWLTLGGRSGKLGPRLNQLLTWRFPPGVLTLDRGGQSRFGLRRMPGGRVRLPFGACGRG